MCCNEDPMQPNKQMFKNPTKTTRPYFLQKTLEQNYFLGSIFDPLQSQGHFENQKSEMSTAVPLIDIH